MGKNTYLLSGQQNIISLLLLFRLVYERDELSEDLSSTRLELDSRITIQGSESTPVTTG